MEKHKIDWLNMPGYKGETWNPIVGCSKVSEGCKNCYAEKMAFRLSNIALTKNKPSSLDYYVDVIRGNKWNSQTYLVDYALNKPLHWEKPRMIFVCSMSDLFHENTSHGDITAVLEIIQRCPQHLFLLLTKRPERALEYFNRLSSVMKNGVCNINVLPFDNIWIGVTAENQEQANKRIPILLKIPAKKRFVSIEPMLGPVDLFHVNVSNGQFIINVSRGLNKLDWVIVGGESGSKARPMHPDWVRSIRDQCKEAKVPFFFKQWGEYKNGSDYTNEKNYIVINNAKYDDWDKNAMDISTDYSSIEWNLLKP